MKKTYKHNSYTSFSLSLVVDGKPSIIDFTDGGNKPFYSPSTFSTSDEKVIEAIEKLEMFGVHIVEVEELEEKVIVTDDITIVDDVCTVQSAREYLNKENGIALVRMPNKEAVLLLAAELNVSFPNLK